MMSVFYIFENRESQQGSALIISLLLLFILTILALAGARNSVLQERMTGNMVDRNMAFQAAEAAMSEGERELRAGGFRNAISERENPGNPDSWITFFNDTSNAGSVYDFDLNISSDDYNYELFASPRFVIEELPQAPNLVADQPPAKPVPNYRHRPGWYGKLDCYLAVCVSTLSKLNGVLTMNKFKLPAVARKLGVMFASALMASVTLSSATAYAAIAQKPLFLTGEGLPPNVLLIPDTSESMQEGLIDGRVALDFSSCTPGQITNPSVCVAGAANTQSKASIVKRTGLALIDDYMDQINLGLLSYQQSPASRSRDDFNSGGTVRWRLVERLLDVRYSNNANPSWYQPATEQAWNSDIKTNRIPSPRGGNRWVFFNTSVVGYDWNTSDGTFGLPTSDRVLFTEETNTRDTANVPPEWFRHTWSQMTGSGGLTNLGTVDIYMTDILRQRGISSWGEVCFSFHLIRWSGEALQRQVLAICMFQSAGETLTALWTQTIGIVCAPSCNRREWIGMDPVTP